MQRIVTNWLLQGNDCILFVHNLSHFINTLVLQNPKFSRVENCFQPMNNSLGRSIIMILYSSQKEKWTSKSFTFTTSFSQTDYCNLITDLYKASYIYATIIIKSTIWSLERYAPRLWPSKKSCNLSLLTIGKLEINTSYINSYETFTH